MDIAELSARMDEFVRDRGWYDEASPKPQEPKNLAISLSLEASELLEWFQWSKGGDVDAVSDELADVILYAVQLANVLQIDLGEALLSKLQRNSLRTWDSPVGGTV